MTFDVGAALVHFLLLWYTTRVLCTRYRVGDRRAPTKSQIQALRSACSVSILLGGLALSADVIAGDHPLLMVKGLWNFFFISTCFSVLLGIHMLEGKGKNVSRRS